MIIRPVIDMPDEPQVRPSARVKTVAQLLDDDPSQVRRMLAEGKLEGHREGKRGVRIFLDSVAEWQRRNPLGKPQATQKGHDKPARPPRSRATNAAHRQAMTHLQRLGLV